MPLRSRTLLALAALVAVAHHGEEGRSVGALQLEQRYQLARRTLEPVLQSLVRAGFLRSTRGARGGYAVESPERLTVGQVVRALDPGLAGPQALRIFQPVLEQALREGHESLLVRLDRITIQELSRRAEASGIGRDLEPFLDYSI